MHTSSCCNCPHRLSEEAGVDSSSLTSYTPIPGSAGVWWIDPLAHKLERANDRQKLRRQALTTLNKLAQEIGFAGAPLVLQRDDGGNVEGGSEDASTATASGGSGRGHGGFGTGHLHK